MLELDTMQQNELNEWNTRTIEMSFISVTLNCDGSCVCVIVWINWNWDINCILRSFIWIVNKFNDIFKNNN